MWEWINQKIEALKNSSKIVITDPHRIIQENDKRLLQLAERLGFVIISASTNLVLRELLLHAEEDEKQKLLLIDHTPPLRKEHVNSRNKAPPLFYPDIISEMPKENIIDINIQQFLIAKTNDTSWPKEANSRKYAKLIIDNLNDVILAHSNLRKVDSKRFSDEDFKKIVAFSALGIPNSAFRNLCTEDLWQLVFVKREKMQALETVAPEIIGIIKSEIRKAEKPFCWFAEDNPEIIVKGFFTSLILSQHTEDWPILLAKVDPAITKFTEISKETLVRFAPEIIRLNPLLADQNILSIESSFSKDALKSVLIDKLNITAYAGYKSILEKESYSVLFRSLAILFALRDHLKSNSSSMPYKEINDLIGSGLSRFAEQRNSETTTILISLYKTSFEISKIRQDLKQFLKLLRIRNTKDWSFKIFWEKWNVQQINRIEYNLSYLERNFDYLKNIIVPIGSEFPEEINKCMLEITQGIVKITEQSEVEINELNNFFQDLVVLDYPKWVEGNSEVVLTSQFIKRCLKPHWDKEKETAVILIFDGMRYDIWEKFLKPVVLNYMDVVEELHASSILPTETHITRKAISAGTYPDEFDTRLSENVLLARAIYSKNENPFPIEAVEPDGLGTGETVRYKGKNIEVYIFELCDKLLHKISVKNIKNREIPSQPLEVVYDQIRNVIEKEVLSIIRKLPKGVKVFITADHGFRRISRNAIWIKKEDLNSEKDCNYLNCRLPVPLEKTQIPKQFHEKIIRFKAEVLHLPSIERWTDRSGNYNEKTVYEVVFPRSEYTFGRLDSRFEPDAWSHGGISLQEMIIPMVALKTKEPETEILNLNLGSGLEFNETEDISFPIKLQIKGKSLSDDIRLDIEASVNSQNERTPIGTKIILLKPWQEQEISFSYKLDSSKVDETERSNGLMVRQLTVTAKYYFGKKIATKTEIKDFKIHLNTERIVRRVGGLGNIIGLSPQRKGSYS